MASVFRIADRIAMIHDGVIEEAGTVDEVKHTANEYVRKFITTSGVEAAVADRAPSEGAGGTRPWSEAQPKRLGAPSRRE
jgi:ABC-type transporter Mla maintaining outer membrane lipid asymmetry ATPase subunit MlaF